MARRTWADIHVIDWRDGFFSTSRILAVAAENDVTEEAYDEYTLTVRGVAERDNWAELWTVYPDTTGGMPPWWSDLVREIEEYLDEVYG
jgi:hypothetical protein